MSFRLNLMGGMQVLADDQPVTSLTVDKVRALLVYLALEPNRPHARTTLADLFWPSLPALAAADNLRKSLYRLRQSLDAAGASSSNLLIITRQTVQLASQVATVDVIQFQNLIAECELHNHFELSTCEACLTRLSEAAALYKGELLAGFGLADAPAFEEWLMFWRETLHQQALQTLTNLCAIWSERGETQRALTYATRILLLDPYREEAHRQKMRLLAQLGFVNQALEQFENCRRLLRVELDIEADAATCTLAEQIRAGEITPASITPAPSKATQLSANATSRASNKSWDDLPDTGHIYGRHTELATLTSWLVNDGCRFVVIWGMGGIGKTTLAAHVAKAVAEQFDQVIWCSLLNAPPLAELLRWIREQLLQQTVVEAPGSLDEQLILLLAALRERRCLLVLDNAESIFETDLVGLDSAGHVRTGHGPYAQFFQRVAESKHNSCLLITSREQLHGMARWEEDFPSVRSLHLDGINVVAGQAMLRARGLIAHTAEMETLVACYSGNPLALKLVAETVQELFAGDISIFLQEETPIFDDIRSVLDGQWVRLSELERELLLWLAIEREAISVQTLHANLLQPPSWREFLEALRALRRRSLLEQTASKPGQSVGFMLQNVVIEYLTSQLIEGVSAEILDGEWQLHSQRQLTSSISFHPLTNSPLNRFALLKTQVNEYIRQSQERLIVQPIANRLLTRLGRLGLSKQITALLALMREQLPLTPGYAAGNLLNLVLHLNLQEMQFDFSRLCVWQPALRGKSLNGLNLSNAQLQAASFTDAFSTTRCLAYSPDGERLAAGLFSGDVRIWRAGDGLPWGICKAQGKAVECLAFSPQGNWLAGGSADQCVYLWDERSGQIGARLAGHNGRVLAVAFHPSGALLASGSEDGTIRLWAINAQGDGECVCTLTAHDSWVRSLAFSPDGKWLVSGGFDCTIRLWKIDQKCVDDGLVTLHQVLTNHQDWVWSVAFSPDGKAVASGSRDRTIQLWDLVDNLQESPQESKKLVLRGLLSGHSSAVNVVAFNQDGSLLASSSDDCTIRLWNPQQLAQVGLLYGHTAMVLSLAFSPVRPALATGSDDNTVRLWDVANPKSNTLLSILQGHFQGHRTLAFSPNGRLLVSGSLDQRLHFWQMDGGSEGLQHGQEIRMQIIRTRAAYVPDGHSLSFDKEGTLLASGSASDTVRLWRLAANNSQELHIPQQAATTAITLNNAGTLVAVGDQQGSIVVSEIDKPAANRIHLLCQGHSSVVTALAFSPQANLLASCSHDGAVCLWQAQNARLIMRLQGHTNALWSLAFSPDGTMLASSSSDRTIRLWKVTTGQTDRILHGHHERIFAIAFTRDGKSLVSGSADQTVRVWDVASGQCRRVLNGHTSWVWAIAVHPDGRRVATGSADETIRLWDIEQGRCLTTLRVNGPYAGMNITGVSGISDTQRTALKALGAVEVLDN